MRASLRFASVAGLALWLGGVIFYGAVVVPAAHEVLGSHREVGFVTRHVTGTANMLGVVVLALLLLNAGLNRPAGTRGRRWLVWGSLAILVLAQTALFFMRARLDSLLDPQALRILDRDRFLWLHERYLNVTSLLCLAGLLHLGTLIEPTSQDGRERI